MKSLSILFFLGTLFTRVIADFEDDAAASYAVFFYLGYIHEWETNQGWTTIGGPDCRDGDMCTFDEFLTATTKSKGGYRGGATITTAKDSSAKANAERLKNAGMTSAIEWEPKKLITNAPDGKNVLFDHVTYVTNAFEHDAPKGGSSQGILDQALDALSNIAEINAGYISREHVTWWKEEGGAPSRTEFNYINLPVEGEKSESVAREIVDTVNIAKTWAYEVPRDVVGIPALFSHEFSVKFKNPHIGHRIQALRLAISACRSGAPYPPGSGDRPIYVPPWG